MKVLITGDLAVTQSYDSKENISQDVLDLFSNSDLNIVNLEAPVTSSESRLLKTGPNLKSHKDSLKAICKALHVKVATLANNHLMDYSEDGVLDTLRFCKNNNIYTVGGGMNLSDASKTLYLNIKGNEVAILNICENEWVGATEDSAGFNPLDIIDNVKDINEAKKRAKHIIVIIHGGHEYYNLPSPRMVKLYRFFADQGADIIIGHHTHCISGYEVYNGVPIFYSLGNFLFTSYSEQKDWYTGIVLEIELKDNKLTPSIHVVKQSRNNFKLELASNEYKSIILKDILEYSQIIENHSSLLEEWNKFVNDKSKAYINYLTSNYTVKNKYFMAVINKLNSAFVSNEALALKLNLMRCEAHNDLSQAVIKKKILK